MSQPPTPDPGFRGTERYQVVRCLGSGSFGVVYEALDAETGQRVALKVPHESRALSLLLFKQEFRALADVSHPNLVSLLELGTSGETWFFVMEKVEGQDLYTRLREGAPPGQPHQSGHYLVPPLGDAHPTPSSSHGSTEVLLSGAIPSPSFYSPPQDYPRVRRAFRQLAEGLLALHGAGIIHRDLKPSNVLITPEERVVLLDFGLAVVHQEADPQVGQGAVGTPAYAAPEQVQAHDSSPASDWYAVGVMLYQVLTGCLPYTGNYLEMLRAKQELDPCPPSLLVRGVPEDLEFLCLDLLAREPGERPQGDDVLARLAGPTRPGAGGTPPRDMPSSATRRRELAALMGGFFDARSGVTTVALVHGISGMGKSTLVRLFAREAKAASPRVLLLKARCFEEERVPFKALDGLMDGLSHFLRRLQPAELQAMLPPHTPALARLFPVLLHVPALATWAGTLPELPDPHEFRRKAFGALRELLGRISFRRPILLIIEDIHWGDADSTQALLELLRPPAAPSLMVLATFDTDERERIPLLSHLMRPTEQPCPVLDLELGPIPREEARQAVLEALDTSGPEAEARADWAAAEAGGSPFFLAELVHFLRTEHPDAVQREAFSLEQHILGKIASLEPGPRRLVELLAVAGHPVSWEGLQRAALVPGHGESLLRGLRVRRLVRARSGGGPRKVEPYHDRVRRAVLSNLDPTRIREDHLRLGEALEAGGHAEPAQLAVHFRAAGLLERAAVHAEHAGDVAAASLAFAQAVEFYRQALELRTQGGEAHARLWPRLAQALALAGRGPEAGDAFLESARASTGAMAEHHRRRAAEELFRSGHTARAMGILAPALERSGDGIPRSRIGATVGLLVSRLRLRLRGLTFVPRSEAELPEAALEQVDALWAIAMGLGSVDILRASDYQARQLRLALELGEPFRVVRGLAHECIFQGAAGNRNLGRTDQILELTLREAERLGGPEPRARALLAQGICAMMQGHWRSALPALEQSALLFREDCQGRHYEMHVASCQSLVALSILGDLPRLFQQLPALLQETEGRGDLMAASHYRVLCGHFPLLAADQPVQALENLDSAMTSCPSHPFQTLHYQEIASRPQVLLYLGRLEEAWAFVEGRWSALRASGMLGIQVARITALEMRARTRLGMASQREGVAQRRLLMGARRDLQRMLKELNPYGEALALKLQAGVARMRGEPERELALLEQAAEGFRHCDMLVHEAACRLALAHLTEAPLAARETEQVFLHRGIQAPWAWTLLHLPWLWTMTPPSGLARGSTDPAFRGLGR